MTADSLEAITALLSASHTASDPTLRLVYLATARAQLTALRARMDDVATLLDAREKELGRASTQAPSKGK